MNSDTPPDPLAPARAAASGAQALPAGTWRRLPVVGPVAAKVLERLLRPHAAREREVTASLVGAIDDLRRSTVAPPAPAEAMGPETLAAVRRDLQVLRAEVAGLRTVIEGNATRTRTESSILAAGLERAEARLDALETAAGSESTEAASAQ